MPPFLRKRDLSKIYEPVGGTGYGRAYKGVGLVRDFTRRIVPLGKHRTENHVIHFEPQCAAGGGAIAGKIHERLTYARTHCVPKCSIVEYGTLPFPCSV